MLDTYWN